MKSVLIREFQISDWQEAWDLWERSLKKSNDSSWSQEKVKTFLERNEDLSLVAVIDGKMAGTIMCGFDGRRGYIYHLVVDINYRKRGIGTALMNGAVGKLRDIGASKIHLMIYNENADAKKFYEKYGFSKRGDITLMSSSCML